MILILQGNNIFAKKLIPTSYQQKWGIKIGREYCVDEPLSILGFPHGMIMGSGFHIGIFWEPCRKNNGQNKPKNKFEPEIGLFFLCKYLTGSRKDILRNTTKKKI